MAYKDDKLKRAQTGFTVEPNLPAPLPEPVFKPNIFSPDNQPSSPERLALLANATGTVESGANRMIVSPQGTTTNFPTSRDIVNQSVQRALTARAASQPVAQTSMLDPYQQSVQDRQRQTEDQLLAGKDRSQFKVEWVSHGMSSSPVLKRLTPEEQQQNWNDMNVALQSEVVLPGGKSTIAPELNIFGGGKYLDSYLYTQSPGERNRADVVAHKKLAKAASEKLDTTLPLRVDNFGSIEDVQDYIKSLNFSPLVGEHVEREITRRLKNINPQLYNKLIGQRELQKANDSAYVEWVRMSADPNVAKLSPEDILAHRTPKEQYAFDRDPNARRYMIGPDGAIIEAPKRIQTAEEKAQEGFKQKSVEQKLGYQQQDEEVANDPNLTISYRNGKREVMTKQQDMILANKQALEMAREERAQNQETLDYDKATRDATKAKNEPEADRRKELESRYDKIVQRMDRTRLNEMKLDEKDVRAQLERDTKLLGAIEKELIPEATATVSHLPRRAANRQP
jgi:hypothetical protein